MTRKRRTREETIRLIVARQHKGECFMNFSYDEYTARLAATEAEVTADYSELAAEDFQVKYRDWLY